MVRRGGGLRLRGYGVGTRQTRGRVGLGDDTMDDERAPELDTVAEPERTAPSARPVRRPVERLVEQRGPALSGADWFFAHAVTMRAAHVSRPVDRPVDDQSGHDED